MIETGLTHFIMHSKHRTFFLVLLLTFAGSLATLGSTQPLYSPTHPSNAVASVPTSFGANTTLTLPASHFILVWRTAEPYHDMVYTWQVRMELLDAAGVPSAAVSYGWHETAKCDSLPFSSQRFCNITPTTALAEVDLLGGVYSLRVVVVFFSASDGSPRPAAALDFNSPEQARALNLLVVGVVGGLAAAPSATLLAYRHFRPPARSPSPEPPPESPVVARVVEAPDKRAP